MTAPVTPRRDAERGPLRGSCGCTRRSRRAQLVELLLPYVLLLVLGDVRGAPTRPIFRATMAYGMSQVGKAGEHVHRSADRTGRRARRGHVLDTRTGHRLSREAVAGGSAIGRHRTVGCGWVMHLSLTPALPRHRCSAKLNNERAAVAGEPRSQDQVHS
jgi:hypothetical protein